MEWEIEFIKARNYVRVIRKGAFSIQKHSNFLEDIVSQEFWKPGTPVLVDYRKADFSRIDFNQVGQALSNLQRISKQFGNSRIAMLMQSMADFGTGRQFELMADGTMDLEMRVFLNEKEALEWLLDKPDKFNSAACILLSGLIPGFLFTVIEKLINIIDTPVAV